jgi:hypothetical protein
MKKSGTLSPKKNGKLSWMSALPTTIFFAKKDILGGEALQSAKNATTLRWQNGKVSTTDGPYTVTKEQLGGILILEARDLNHAIQLMSRHPGVKAGPFEIRPAEDLAAMIAESERRRSKTRGERL